MAEVVFENTIAPGKVLLHAYKHPFGAVNGVLLGRAEAGRIVVADAVPLFHEHTTLAPMLEVALAAVRACLQHIFLRV